ncbi:MAG: hypothetical protein ACK5AZ_12140 [Bryobacteraceae bacterium]
MFKSLDIFVGLALIMLVMSMAVTLLTQALTGVLRSRARQLRQGLIDMLLQVDAAAFRPHAGEIATAVLSHPLVCGFRGSMGSVVHREELIRLLLELSTGNSPQPLGEKARTALQAVLQRKGVPDPAAALANIDGLAMRLETVHPNWGASARQSAAILEEAAGDFVAKIFCWFDQTIDRVTQRFTSEVRVLTFLAALVFAFAIQLDTFGIVNRLSIDDAVRAELVSAAVREVQPAQSLEELTPQRQELIRNLSARQILGVPRSLEEWRGHLATRFPGILVSAILLSLGAPFWFSTLKNLLRLRSVLASRDDEQRSERQQQTGAAPPPVAPSGGEQGNLTALG